MNYRRNPALPPTLTDDDKICVQKALRSVIQNQGILILDDPKKIRALLSDLCPEDHKRKIVLIERLLDDKVHLELLRQKDSLSYEHLSENLTNRILANHPFDIQLVQWGIDTISVSLGIIQKVSRNQSILKPPQSPSNFSNSGSDQPVDDFISQAIGLNKSSLFHEALDLLNRVIKKDPGNAIALREKGFALSNLERYDEALHMYDMALSENPHDTLIWTYRAYALSKIGRMRDAIQSCDAAIKLDSHNAIAWRSKGYSLSKMHNHNAAMICYQEALDINPDDPKTWNLVGWVKRDWDEKLRAFDRALSLDPAYIPAMINKGWILSKKGKFEDALIIYKQVLTIDKNNQKAWKEIGYCLKMMQEQNSKKSYPATHSPQRAPTPENQGIIDKLKGFFK